MEDRKGAGKEDLEARDGEEDEEEEEEEVEEAKRWKGTVQGEVVRDVQAAAEEMKDEGRRGML